MSALKVQKQIRSKASKDKAKVLQRFFKTGKGQYGEGDVFVGVTVPELRKIAKENREISLTGIKKLLQSKVHEDRFIALQILRIQYESAENPKKYVDFYIKNRKYVNNWDLVDTSTHYILGDYLKDKKDRSILYKFSESKNLWERRMSILATFAFINQNDFGDTFKISENLLKDQNDLIHKAVGWMIREVGKRDQQKLEKFLKKHYKKMPRTMLRYAIEKFPETKRKKYLNGKI
jgi:3-methyladenine DNA glycosylase AlkD